ncbi:MAG: sigma-54-dependent Fis family transcriptional regulator [SAR86 cluster bacterium]|uniref:Sigma-54-dependent Fis family transcriptional regulator n=1 Tax=SAR86 cluster bacterium TaxID=2030880 RepID=A0A2A5B5K1_9GAMM|nr:MAG: sigma-54-dependent Fis family transcriptional regulator [SAR86 cluster bacterium]
MNKTLLTISDDGDVIAKMTAVFEFIGKEVTFSNSYESAKNELEANSDLSLVFISLNEKSQEAKILEFLNHNLPLVPIYLIRRENELCHPSKAPKGVVGQIRFPVNYKSLMRTIRQAELEKDMGNCNDSYPVSLSGNSPEIRKVEALIHHVSQSDANVLLLGESGTGKEVVARGIHKLSIRAEQPFIAVNCGAIPPDLLESELFGHEKGAFTGAINTRRGRFELAEGGTLFLDEIGDMPLPMQVKLLRVIQERAYERVGGTKTIVSNVRLIAATHQDLEKRIDEGKFRTDLFYRLNVFPIELSPLRDRSSDIPILLKEFASKMQLELEQSTAIEFDESAIEALADHPLPGNVREIENLVERLAILYPGEVISNEKLPDRYQLTHSTPATIMSDSSASQTYCIPPDANLNADIIDLKTYLSSLEKNLIYQALDNTNWVVSKAARSLSLRRTTLIQKIRKLGIHNQSIQSNVVNA